MRSPRCTPGAGRERREPMRLIRAAVVGDRVLSFSLAVAALLTAYGGYGGVGSSAGTQTRWRSWAYSSRGAGRSSPCTFCRVESWRADVRVRWHIHSFRCGPQSGSRGLRFQLPPPRTQRADLPLLKRSCTILIKGYGTYHTGAAFDAGNRDRRYPLKSPTRSYS